MLEISFVIPIVVSCVITAALVPVSMFVAAKLGMLDQPEARKVHTNPTPRLGGIAIYAGVSIAILISLLAIVFGPDQTNTYHWSRPLIGMLGAITLIFSVGLVDDIRPLSSRFKLISLLGAAAMICGSGIQIEALTTPSGQILSLGNFAWPVTMLFIVGVAVSVNFADGLDGLAGGLVLLAALVLSTFAIASHHDWIAIAPLALSGALAAFLLYNWHPAKTFMGDCGSMTIGVLLAASMASGNAELGTMRSVIVPMLALSVPVADTLLTFFRRRYQQRRSMFSAERGHIHHRLLDRGLGHLHTVLLIHSFSLLAVLVGIIALAFDGWSTLGGLAVMVPMIWGIFRFAGSVKTSEMIAAIRSKRGIDKSARAYRSRFETSQLEMNKANSFVAWWDCVCHAAERLGFVRVDLTIENRNGKHRQLEWEAADTSWDASKVLSAVLPVAAPNDPNNRSHVKIAVDARASYESASERLALFARLIAETNLITIRKRECQRKGQLDTSSGAQSLLELSDSHPNAIFPGLRVAVVQDFLYVNAGAERVLKQIIGLFPQCDVYSLFDFLPEEDRELLNHKPVRTSFIQKLPFAKQKHRAYLPLMPFAIEQLDFSGYDLVVSSSYLVAKGVITGPDQLHVCYCHSPARYVWDLQHQYLAQSKLGFGPKGLLARLILHYLRTWDVRSSMGVDHFIANSQFVARRIQKLYRRDSVVINPPVDTEQFRLADEKEDYYVVAGRMVPYKRTDLIIEAFAKMPKRKLIIVGAGPDFEKAKLAAGPNVTLVGYQSNEVLADYVQRAKALIFAAEEDFGIVPVEALACGTPVIAYGRGGVTESVVEGKHGVFFNEQTSDAIVDAIERFEASDPVSSFPPEVLRERSQDFSNDRFLIQMCDFLTNCVNQRWPQLASNESADKQAASEVVEHFETKTLGEFVLER